MPPSPRSANCLRPRTSRVWRYGWPCGPVAARVSPTSSSSTARSTTPTSSKSSATSRSSSTRSRRRCCAVPRWTSVTGSWERGSPSTTPTSPAPAAAATPSPDHLAGTGGGTLPALVFRTPPPSSRLAFSRVHQEASARARDPRYPIGTEGHRAVFGGGGGGGIGLPLRPGRLRPRDRRARPRRHRGPDAPSPRQHRTDPRRSRPRLSGRGQDHHLPGRHRRLPQGERDLRRVLRRSPSSPVGLPGRSPARRVLDRDRSRGCETRYRGESMNEILEAFGLTDDPVPGVCVAGEWRQGSGGVVEIPNPATGEVLARVSLAGRDDYEAAVSSSVEAFLRWRTLPAPQRGEYVRRLGNALRERKEELGALVSLEVGKILPEGLGEVQE